MAQAADTGKTTSEQDHDPKPGDVSVAHGAENKQNFDGMKMMMSMMFLMVGMKMAGLMPEGPQNNHDNTPAAGNIFDRILGSGATALSSLGLEGQTVAPPTSMMTPPKPPGMNA